LGTLSKALFMSQEEAKIKDVIFVLEESVLINLLK
jgi:hypothetical protein